MISLEKTHLYCAVNEVKELVPVAELPKYTPCHAVVALVGALVLYLMV